jgi:hypothetical protein
MNPFEDHASASILATTKKTIDAIASIIKWGNVDAERRLFNKENFVNGLFSSMNIC